MTWLSQSDIDRLAADLAVANSGSYILRRFRGDPTVRTLAFRTFAELLQRIREINPLKSPALADEVEGYAAAVALTIGGHAKALAGYAQVTQGSLKWLKQIAELASENPGPSRIVKTIRPNEYQFDISTPASVTVVSTSTGSVSVSDGKPS